ncbi:hypothetical protein EK21DRAFT_62348 [Setomelanomma holmii]|uniref:Flavin reductase like domain-containing protein n=1 Tax=Setomelanomma holmii TaxID=210430 RepID=A0A9P4LQI4_9PLEO|nr:hypothetical protein EK21DRAFT_62348 [Setomelanomma holmii]
MLVEVDESEIDTARLRNEVRGLMRNVPSSVAVITVASYDAELKRHVPMGVAVSSLSTVTLDPPTISFNIKQPSKTLDAIRAANGLFRVHFPSGTRGGAAIVELFCRGNHPEAYVARTRGLKIFVPRPESHQDRSHASVSLAPQLLDDSVRASMECALTQELTVEDHVILVAKVDSMVGKTLKDTRDRTIVYVDGTYIRPDGSRISPHDAHVASTGDNSFVWDYPLFPRDEHRRDYVDRLKAIVNENPKAAMQGSKESLRDLEASLALSPGALGINLERLVDECRREAAMSSTSRNDLVDVPVLSEFWGRLAPADKVKIIERAQSFVKENPQFLMLNYRNFLHLLGKSRARLHAEASPELFSGSNIDITGHASIEEARVIMARVIKFMQIDNITAFRKSLNMDPFEVLRRTGVHPSITAFNVEFFFGKLKHLFYSTQHSRDLPRLVEKMVDLLFVSTVTWEDLGRRVKEFVQKAPTRAMTWSLRDSLAALGLRWESTLSVPLTKSEQPLNRGHILETLIAKELKNLYGKSTKKLDEAIAHHLKTTYNYDVHKPIQYSPAKEDSRSSADVLADARKANWPVDVSGSKKAKGWEEHGKRASHRPLKSAPRNTSSWKSFKDKVGSGPE